MSRYRKTNFVIALFFLAVLIPSFDNAKAVMPDWVNKKPIRSCLATDSNVTARLSIYAHDSRSELFVLERLNMEYYRSYNYHIKAVAIRIYNIKGNKLIHRDEKGYEVLIDSPAEIKVTHRPYWIVPNEIVKQGWPPSGLMTLDIWFDAVKDPSDIGVMIQFDNCITL